MSMDLHTTLNEIDNLSDRMKAGDWLDPMEQSQIVGTAYTLGLQLSAATAAAQVLRFACEEKSHYCLCQCIREMEELLKRLEKARELIKGKS